MRSMTSAAPGIRPARGVARGLLVSASLLTGCFSPSGTTGTAGTSTSTGGTTTGGTGTTVAATTSAVTTGAPTTTGATTSTSTTTTGESTTDLTLTGLLTTGLLTTGVTESTTALTDTTLTDTTLTTLETTGDPFFCGDGVVQPPEECDDGNANDSDGCSAGCTFEFRYVFVSSATYVGKDMGGALGGDAKCKALAATNPGLLAGRKFAAWLSTGMMDAKDRIGASTIPYVLTDGLTQVAANASGLFDDGLDAPIDRDEWGNPAADAAHVWTGTLASGLAAPSHCSGWSNAGVNGWAGLWTEFDIQWTDSIELLCAQARRIYCIEVPQ